MSKVLNKLQLLLEISYYAKNSMIDKLWWSRITWKVSNKPL